MYYTFGIDIGGTKVKIGLFKDGLLTHKWSIDTKRSSFIKDIAKSILDYCQTNKIEDDEILGYGIGVPSMVQNEIAINCVNLGIKNLDVKKEFQKAMNKNVCVSVANDARLAAYGEYSILENKPEAIVFVTLGTGVGGGIIKHNQIDTGVSGLCGEIGHIRIDREHQFQCACGKTGCLETVSSATGLVRLYKHYANQENLTISAKDIVDLAKKGDQLGLKVLDEASMYIARVLAILALTVNPNMFIIGGGVSEAGEILLNKIKEHYLLECLDEAKNTDIQLSKLRNDAGIYGASALVIQKRNGAK